MHRQNTDVLRIGHAAAAIGVSVDTLRRWDGEGRATFVRRSGKRWMTLEEVARLREVHAVRAPVPPQAVNVFDALVTAVHEREASVDLELELGAQRLGTTISRATADQLGARVGRVVRVRINPAEVSVERDDLHTHRAASGPDG